MSEEYEDLKANWRAGLLDIDDVSGILSPEDMGRDGKASPSRGLTCSHLMSDIKNSDERLVSAYRKLITEKIRQAERGMESFIQDGDYAPASAFQQIIRGYEDSLNALDEVCKGSQEWCHLQREKGL